MYWHKTPKLIQWLYPNLIWHKSRSQKTLFVTFDDGPVPEVTPAVLDILDEYNAKATFFCVGDNVAKYPEVYQQVLQRGHVTANHTFNHLNSWDTSLDEYLANVEKCKDSLNLSNGIRPLFRPPYGKIKRNAARELRKEYDIIMWDVLAGDFDQSLTQEDCLNNSIKATSSGSIIIFHDSQKAKDNMLFALPRYLEHFDQQGYNFKAL